MGCWRQEDLKAQCKATMKVTTLAGRVRWFKRIGEGGGAPYAALTCSAVGLGLLSITARHKDTSVLDACRLVTARGNAALQSDVLPPKPAGWAPTRDFCVHLLHTS